VNNYGCAVGVVDCLDPRRGWLSEAAAAAVQAQNPTAPAGASAGVFGLVFTGESNGHFNACDAGRGKTPWTCRTGANVGAPPTSCAANGGSYRQRYRRGARGSTGCIWAAQSWRSRYSRSSRRASKLPAEVVSGWARFADLTPP
jgi:outer membrane protein assembly factor BamB